MKLKQILEADSKNFRNNNLIYPIFSNHLYNPMTGHDSGSRAAGFTSHVPSGTPHKPKYRTFLGMNKRLGSIRL